MIDPAAVQVLAKQLLQTTYHELLHGYVRQRIDAVNAAPAMDPYAVMKARGAVEELARLLDPRRLLEMATNALVAQDPPPPAPTEAPGLDWWNGPAH